MKRYTNYKIRKGQFNHRRSSQRSPLLEASILLAESLGESGHGVPLVGRAALKIRKPPEESSAATSGESVVVPPTLVV